MLDPVVASAMLLALAVTGLACAAALRLESVLSTLLAAYLAVVAETVLLTTALSPFRRVNRGGLGVGEALLLVVTIAVWWRRGRPLPAVRHVPAVLRSVARDPACLLLLAAVTAALVYELVLVLTVPPNNWDSLTYHLTRVAAWAQHGGVYWIPNAPTARVNDFQPIAEQEILFLFVATGRGALYALPQYLAELAILPAIYIGARRIGFGLRQGMCAALFAATLPLVALEATTSQNDLVAASLVAVAAAFLLGSFQIELVLAGVATAVGFGVKLTTALVLPVLVLLALARGRRVFGWFTLAGAAGFAALGVWGFALNLDKTGRLLGHGGDRLTVQASPSFTGTPTTVFRVFYRLLDLAGFGGLLLVAFAGIGILAGFGTYLFARRRGGPPRAAAFAGGLVALPLLTPRLIPDVAHVLKIVADAMSLPVNAPAWTAGRFFWGITYGVSEDLSAFGPLGGPALLLISVFVVYAGLRRRIAPRIAFLGLALPLFVVLLSLTSKYNPWLSRFALVPVALAAPLFALLFQRREVAFAIAVVAVAGLVGVQLHNQPKPFHGSRGFVWQLSQADAAALTFEPASGAASAALARTTPEVGCLGAVLGPDEPAYLLFGPHLGHRITFLPRTGAVAAARRDRLTSVVVGHVGGVAASFAAAGWRLDNLPARPAKRYWILATAPGAPIARCAT